MDLVSVVLVLVVVGVLLWLINAFIAMPYGLRSILNAFVVIGLVIWLLYVFGLIHRLPNYRPR
jgi:hypothetical protein